MRVAVADELILRSPCTIKGAGVEHAPERPVANIVEVEALSDAIDERLRLAVLLAAWCGLRRGELLGLERRDINLEAGNLRVDRTRQGLENGQVVVGPPKTEAGRRIVSIPPHLLPLVADHLDRFTGPADETPVFTGVKGGPLRAFMLHNSWKLARTKAGLDHLHFHDLRHSGNTWAATTGASTRELMARMGHASASAALRYQHATRDRDRAIAEALSSLASAAHRSNANSKTEPIDAN
jgi:integrase